MVGDAAQQRTRRDIVEMFQRPFDVAFLAQFAPHEANGGVLDPGREVEQHRIGTEIVEQFGFEILDVRESGIAQQAGPVIVGAHLHAALVLANRGRRRIEAGIGLVDEIIVEMVLCVMRAKCAAKPVHHSKAPECELRCSGRGMGQA